MGANDPTTEKCTKPCRRPKPTQRCSTSKEEEEEERIRIFSVEVERVDLPNAKKPM
jgi:hypothetical protein